LFKMSYPSSQKCRNSMRRPVPLTCMAFIAALLCQNAWPQNLRITLPKYSELTPVQRLNREGVSAIQDHQYEKAEAIFYKAYLYDPADPFTLNNLGYISELEGKLDRALKFYALASEQGSGALVDRSNDSQLEGKPMNYALSGLKNVPLQVNRMNVQAMELLSQGLNFEADLLLRQALALDPRNPFTLNNLGVAEEATGDYESALKYYTAAADSGSAEPVVVTLKDSWRGRPVVELAAESARRLKKRIDETDPAQLHAEMLTLRGVSATNRNDWQTAKQDFLQAYSIDPNSAFSLNNLGYVAEKDGDLETAQLLYAKARKAGGADARIGLATDRSAEGKHLTTVATDSDQKVDSEIDQNAQALHRETGPVQLIHRDNTPVAPPAK
jgi:Flp pilus assembly protein TadD